MAELEKRILDFATVSFQIILITDVAVKIIYNKVLFYFQHFKNAVPGTKYFNKKSCKT